VSDDDQPITKAWIGEEFGQRVVIDRGDEWHKRLEYNESGRAVLIFSTTCGIAGDYEESGFKPKNRGDFRALVRMLKG
jgi:hypothetical protein